MRFKQETARKTNGKKGFTLAELTVAIAVVAVITGMVISFTVLINAQTKKATQMLDVQQELDLAEEMVRYWIAYFDTNEYTFSQENGVLISTQKTDATKTYCIYLEDGMLFATYPDGTPRFTPLGYVSAVTFTLITDSGWAVEEAEQGDIFGELIRCDFAYLEPAASDNASPKIVHHVFLVSTRISFDPA